MSIKSDRWITKMSKQHGMIEPFADRQVRAGVISYGVSSYGYDKRVAPEFKIFTNAVSAGGEPNRVRPQTFRRITGAGSLGPLDFLSPCPHIRDFPHPPYWFAH